MEAAGAYPSQPLAHFPAGAGVEYKNGDNNGVI